MTAGAGRGGRGGGVGGIFACVLALGASAAGAQAPECPPQIRVAFTQASLPPFVLGEGAGFQDPPGLFVHWTQVALEKLGCERAAVFVRLPYHRIVASMTSGAVDIRVTGGYLDELKTVMAFPMTENGPNRKMAVAESGTMLYVLANQKPPEWDGTTLRLTGANPSIGAVRGHYTEKIAQARQWEVDSAPNWESNLKKLQSGRVAAIIGPEAVVDALPDRPPMRKLLPPVAMDDYYAPVSRQFYDKYPAFTERFWLEVCRQSRSTFTSLPPCSLK